MNLIGKTSSGARNTDVFYPSKSESIPRICSLAADASVRILYRNHDRHPWAFGRVARAQFYLFFITLRFCWESTVIRMENLIQGTCWIWMEGKGRSWQVLGLDRLHLRLLLSISPRLDPLPELGGLTTGFSNSKPRTMPIRGSLALPAPDFGCEREGKPDESSLTAGALSWKAIMSNQAVAALLIHSPSSPLGLNLFPLTLATPSYVRSSSASKVITIPSNCPRCPSWSQDHRRACG